MLAWVMHHAEVLETDPNGRPWRYGMLAQALEARGHRVVQWAPTFAHYTRHFRSPSETVLRVRNGTEVQLVDAGSYANNVSVRRIRFEIRLARRFTEIALRREPPDVIVCSMPTPEWCLATLRFGRPRNIAVLLDVRDLWPDAIYDLIPRPVRFIGKALLGPLERRNARMFASASGVTAISSTYLQWALDYAGRSRGSTDGVFPIGFPSPSISEEGREAARAAWKRRGVTGQAFTCCFAGTMSRQYWLDDVIRAAGQLPDATFVLCGDGDRREGYQRMARGLPNVVMPGWVSPEEVNGLMSLSHAGLAAYRGEAPMSLPNKPFEYMSVGLPIVSSLEGELKELLEDNKCGLSYRAGDVDGLARCLRRLRDDAALRDSMSRNAKRLYEERFRPDLIYDRMAAFLEDVVARNLGRPGGAVQRGPR